MIFRPANSLSQSDDWEIIHPRRRFKLPLKIQEDDQVPVKDSSRRFKTICTVSTNLIQFPIPFSIHDNVYPVHLFHPSISRSVHQTLMSSIQEKCLRKCLKCKKQTFLAGHYTKAGKIWVPIHNRHSRGFKMETVKRNKKHEVKKILEDVNEVNSSDNQYD